MKGDERGSEWRYGRTKVIARDGKIDPHENIDVPKQSLDTRGFPILREIVQSVERLLRAAFIVEKKTQ